MKILTPLPDKMINSLVHQMMYATQEMGKRRIESGFQLDIDQSLFWNKKTPEHELIHIHWPEGVFEKWNIDHTPLENIKRLEKRLEYLKSNEKKIVITRHNSVPHSKHPLDVELYKISFSYADAVFHMDEYSVVEFMSMYENYEWSKRIKHYFAPLPMFCNLPNRVSQKEARNKLKIPSNKFVLMVFGKIRHQEEIKLLKDFAKALKYVDGMLYVSQYPYKGRYPIRKGFCLLDRVKFPSHRFIESKYILDEDIQYYLNAGDALLIPRTDSLNSGLISLAFTFGKVAIGPRCGNIKNILEKANNPTFEIDDTQCIMDSIILTTNLVKNGQGFQNLKYARDNWNLTKVGNAHIDGYLDILESVK